MNIENKKAVDSDFVKSLSDPLSRLSLSFKSPEKRQSHGPPLQARSSCSV